MEADIARVSPETKLRHHGLAVRDPWDLEEVYGALHDFAKAYPFRSQREDYLGHISTGTHITQICLFLLTESRHFPGRLLQTSPSKIKRDPSPGSYQIIDLDLHKYDRPASRFRREQQEGLSFLKSGIATRNRPFNELIEEVERVAISSSDPHLLMGPTGSGSHNWRAGSTSSRS